MLLQLLIYFLIPLNMLMSSPTEEEAKKHIVQMKNGVVLVRLHTDEAAQVKMKQYRQFKKLRAKQQEVKEDNTNTYNAFTQFFTFTSVYFFYARDTKKILAKDYENVFLDSNLQVSNQISIAKNTTVYIIDVGNIYFEAFGGHFEGYGVLDHNLKSLEKPFPYYMKRRSGVAIIKRTDNEMVMKLNKQLSSFYSKCYPEQFN